MIFERIKTPGIAHVAYLIGNKGEAVVVDPRRDVDEYVTLARSRRLTIRYVLETHRQEDFVMGSAELAKKLGAKVVTVDTKLFGHSDIRLADGEELELAGRPDRGAAHARTHAGEHVLRGVPRRTRPTARGASSPATRCSSARPAAPTCRTGRRPARTPACSSTRSTRKLLPLGDQTLLWPAHGSGSVCGGNIAERDDSTLGFERTYNPVFVRSRADVHRGARSDERIPRPPYFEPMERWNSKGGCGQLTAGERRPRARSRRTSGRETKQASCSTRASRRRSPAGTSRARSTSGRRACRCSPAGSPRPTPVYLVLDDAGRGLDDAVKALGRVGVDHVEGVLAGSFDGWRDHGLPMAGVGTIEPGRSTSIPRSATCG